MKQKATKKFNYKTVNKQPLNEIPKQKKIIKKYVF